MMKKMSSVFALFFLVLMSSLNAWAKDFPIGQKVFVAFEAGNIKDDAFIVGLVKKVMPNGDYLLDVQEYVKGHDYGSSCVPISKYEDPNATAQGYDKGWELWTDRSELNVEDLDYIVPKERVMTLDYGKHYFVERNNLYFVYGRWLSDAPVLTEGRIMRAMREAKIANLHEMLPALEMMRRHRVSFYDENNRPLYPFERIAPLNHAMDYAFELFAQDPKLEQLWSAKPRNWDEISKSSK